MAEREEDEMWAAGALVVAGIALAAFLFVPAVLATALYFGTQRYLSRRNMMFLGLVGLLGTVLLSHQLIGVYPKWAWSLVTGDFNAPPIALIVSLALFLVGVYAFLLGTRISERLPGALKNRSEFDNDSVLPTLEEKQSLDSVPPAPGGLMIDPSDHDIVSAPAGSRQFPLAVGRNGDVIYIKESEIRTHGLILGATGSGKTETIKVVTGALLDLGWDGMIVDLKEDTAPGGLRDWCRTYAYHHSIPYQQLCLSAPESDTWFNPLDGMGPDEMRDTILALQDFDDAYWQSQNKALLGQIVNLSTWAHQVNPTLFAPPSMYELGKLMSTGSLKEATKVMRAAVLQAVPGVSREDFRDLESPSADMQKSATGYGAKLTLIYDTKAGRTVLRPGDAAAPRRALDVTNPGLTYVGLDSQGKPDLTQVISSAMLQRMSVYAADRTTGRVGDDRKPRFLIVDEANWINREIVQNLLSRARSAGIAMILCTQGPNDWIDKQGDDWAKLTQNVNVSVIMAQGNAESALLCADYIGKVYKKQRSETIRESRGLLWNKPVRSPTGEVMESHSIKEELVHLIDPDDFRRMGVGEAVIRVSRPSERITWGRIPMRDPRTGPARRS